MSGRNKSWIKPVVLAVVITAAGGPGVAMAESNERGHGHCGARHGGDMHGKSMHEPGRYVEGKLAFLEAELGITEDQEPAWQEFAAVIRESERARSDRWQERREHWKEERKSGRDERSGLDERIDRRLEAMDRRVATFTKIGEAAKKLYAQLTPEQQRTADDMLPPGRGHRRHFRF